MKSGADAAAFLASLREGVGIAVVAVAFEADSPEQTR
jgi:hypothetical protein